MIVGSSKRHQSHPSNVWQWLAVDDSTLEQSDLVEINLTLASGIPGLESLDIDRYVNIVDDWTDQFRRQLPDMERMFRATPERWKNDIGFFRVGMLMGFLGHVIGITYIEEQKHAQSVRYTDPGHLFLHGLIDTKQGTCGNMAALHVAMCRRMGWPVSLACARSHLLSRFDDGNVIHNIEATSTHPGTIKACYCGKQDLAQILADSLQRVVTAPTGTYTIRPFFPDSSNDKVFKPRPSNPGPTTRPTE